MGRDAAVVRSAAPPPLAAADGVGHEVCRHALARTHQLLDRLGTAARPVSDVTVRAQLPTAQLRGTWVEEQNITVTLVASAQNKHFEVLHTGKDILQVNCLNAAAVSDSNTC